MPRAYPYEPARNSRLTLADDGVASPRNTITNFSQVMACSGAPVGYCSDMGDRTRVLRRLGVVGAVLIATGCSTPGTTLESTPEVLLWSVGTALHQPVW